MILNLIEVRQLILNLIKLYRIKLNYIKFVFCIYLFIALWARPAEGSMPFGHCFVLLQWSLGLSGGVARKVLVTNQPTNQPTESCWPMRPGTGGEAHTVSSENTWLPAWRDLAHGSASECTRGLCSGLADRPVRWART